MAGGKGADGGSPDVGMPCALRLCCAGRALGVGFGSICWVQRNAVPRCCLCCAAENLRVPPKASKKVWHSMLGKHRKFGDDPMRGDCVVYP